MKRFIKYLLAACLPPLVAATIMLGGLHWFLADNQLIYPKDLKARLLPKIWSAKNLAPVGQVNHYIANPSDGPKAADTRIIFTTLNRAALSTYLAQAGYHPQGPLQWQRPDSEIVLELSGDCLILYYIMSCTADHLRLRINQWRQRSLVKTALRFL